MAAIAAKVADERGGLCGGEVGGRGLVHAGSHPLSPHPLSCKSQDCIEGGPYFQHGAPAMQVGYHIGQDNMSGSRTSLLFCTAGIALEMLRVDGVSQGGL